jgi:hypothetical protein
MAELVDAADLKSAGRKTVGVQVPLPPSLKTPAATGFLQGAASPQHAALPGRFLEAAAHHPTPITYPAGLEQARKLAEELGRDIELNRMGLDPFRFKRWLDEPKTSVGASSAAVGIAHIKAQDSLRCPLLLLFIHLMMAVLKAKSWF